MSDDTCPECGESWMSDEVKDRCPTCGCELPHATITRLTREQDEMKEDIRFLLTLVPRLDGKDLPELPKDMPLYETRTYRLVPANRDPEVIERVESIRKKVA